MTWWMWVLLVTPFIVGAAFYAAIWFVDHIEDLSYHGGHELEPVEVEDDVDV